MIFFGILIGVIIMGVMIYLALGKKSSFHIRIASLGALAVMILSVIICIIVFSSSGDKVTIDWSTYKVGEPIEAKDTSGDTVGIIFSIIFFLVLFVVIAVLALKEHKKHAPQKDKPLF